MAQTYTLDEAAGKLGIGVDEFKRRLRDQWKHIRSLRDGSTLRFKSNEIDELARSTVGSDDSIDLEHGDETRVAPVSSFSKRPPSDDDIPLVLDSGPDLFLSDLPQIKSPTDSDVRLEKSSRSKQVKQDHTEEISLDMPLGKGIGASGRLGSSQKLGGMTSKLPKLSPKDKHDESEFELTLETDSDEFELSLNPDSASEEIDLASLPTRKTAGPRSGINIGRPADSGISLERTKKKVDSSEDIEFEINLDSSGHHSSRNLKNDSDSEFELNLDESSDSHSALDGEKGDIFETDFELPALDDDSASEVQALDESADTDLENSDFDLAIEGVESDSDSAERAGESASEVVEIDEDDMPKAKKGKPKKLKGNDDDGGISFDDMDLDESMSASRALRGVKTDDDGIMVDDDGNFVTAASSAAGVAMVAAAAPWGVLPVVLLIPCMFLMFLGGLMGYELLHSMWGYQQPSKPAGILVEGVAKIFGVEPKE